MAAVSLSFLYNMYTHSQSTSSASRVNHYMHCSADMQPGEMYFRQFESEGMERYIDKTNVSNRLIIDVCTLNCVYTALLVLLFISNFQRNNYALMFTQVIPIQHFLHHNNLLCG